MKKIKIITAIILCIILILSLCVPAFAVSLDAAMVGANEIPKTIPEDECLYKELFLTQYKDRIIAGAGEPEYYELYHHQNENGEVDYAIVFATIYPVAESFAYGVLGDRVIVCANISDGAFCLKYGVYIAEDNMFYPIEKLYEESTYPEIREAFEKLNVGFLIGDMDNDNKITIIDATIIQRCLAEVDSFDREDKLKDYFWATNETIGYISDFDRDGERTIMDATAIQRHLAKIV